MTKTVPVGRSLKTLLVLALLLASAPAQATPVLVVDGEGRALRFLSP